MNKIKKSYTWKIQLTIAINPNRGGSYIDFPDWMKNKKSDNKSNQ